MMYATVKPRFIVTTAVNHMAVVNDPMCGRTL
jgi:hypothetical protein